MIRNQLTYISLFSSAGVGCYGFKKEKFECIATNEIIARRMNIQKYNSKCKYDSGYITGDITLDETKNKIQKEIKMWSNLEKDKDVVDVIIATPPCQGMSVVNHKKNDEGVRNSLVIESIKIIKNIKPKIFIFENVRAFLKTVCMDIDQKQKTIKKAIFENLEIDYKIEYKILNFKNYGGISSRTRTIVIGVRRNIENIIPEELFPQYEEEKTLKDVIFKLKRLKDMGEIDEKDIYHQFKKYSLNMREWIKDIKEGQSAFDNKDPEKRPNNIVDGKIKYNKKLNSDKYTRQVWNKVAPCVHTRNDILASQATVHPEDDRVFSIRELMIMMNIPNDFKWTDIDMKKLNSMDLIDKREFLKKNEINIRQSIGEAVPTEIFRKIASNIKSALTMKETKLSDIKKLIKDLELDQVENLKKYIKAHVNKTPLNVLYKIAELSNCNRNKNAAYYTDLDICEKIVQQLPEFKKDEVNILEPSVGIGNFIYFISKHYSTIKKINIDVIDIDKNMLDICKIILDNKIKEQNIQIRYLNEDYLKYKADKKYDIILGNPPFEKINASNENYKEYKNNNENKETNNLFAFFIEKALKESEIVSLVTPKSLVNAPEFNLTRNIINEKHIVYIIDFGEHGFKGIKIETINIIISNKVAKDKMTKVISYINKDENIKKQDYITKSNFKSWLLYRNEWFDKFTENKTFNVFDAYRDRQITNNMLKDMGNIRIAKSRNIANGKIINIEGYDQYIDNIENLSVKKYINNTSAILVPNLTYNPRACFMPKDTIPNGSVAVLIPKKSFNIKDEHLQFYSTDEFREFYKIARNYGTRSLNIDSNSVEFFCIKEENDGAKN